jgi:hypothetical protein
MDWKLILVEKINLCDTFLKSYCRQEGLIVWFIGALKNKTTCSLNPYMLFGKQLTGGIICIIREILI